MRAVDKAPWGVGQEIIVERDETEIKLSTVWHLGSQCQWESAKHCIQALGNAKQFGEFCFPFLKPPSWWDLFVSGRHFLIWNFSYASDTPSRPMFLFFVLQNDPFHTVGYIKAEESFDWWFTAVLGANALLILSESQQHLQRNWINMQSIEFPLHAFFKLSSSLK